MQIIGKLLSQPKSRRGAIAMALLVAVLPFPLAGLHKFYLGQPLWGAIYLLLWNTPVPRMAAAIDAVWYFVQGKEAFNRQFNNILSTSSVIAASC
jgi:TM2 domain-containing membrane protein YozV